ncbi:hypothetical protein ACYJ1Y_08965 [Natrialbaceae archaeon A-gly3]
MWQLPPRRPTTARTCTIPTPTTDELEATLERAGERVSFESARDDPVEVRIVAVVGQGEAIVLEETVEL